MMLYFAWVSALVVGMFSAHVLQTLFFPYFWKDFFFLLSLIRFGAKLELFRLTSRVCTVLDRFIQQAHRIPDKPFIIYEGSVHTYKDIEERSNRLANVFLQKLKITKGDCVAMLMNNEPDFVCVWFGLAKVGCPVAFLNTNIKSRSLLHCINSCGAKAVIVGADLVECVHGIISDLLEDNIQVWTMKSHCGDTNVESVMDHIEAATDKPVPASLRATTSLKSPTLYIFTSGTTGLPKAAVITHLQSLKAAGGFWAFGVTENDVIYIPLPLYHSAASLLGIGGTIALAALGRPAPYSTPERDRSIRPLQRPALGPPSSIRSCCDAQSTTASPCMFQRHGLCGSFGTLLPQRRTRGHHRTLFRRRRTRGRHQSAFGASGFAAAMGLRCRDAGPAAAIGVPPGVIRLTAAIGLHPSFAGPADVSRHQASCAKPVIVPGSTPTAAARDGSCCCAQPRLPELPPIAVQTSRVAASYGATCILKKKFSVSQFWTDCRKHNATVFQYIGELCRYLCNQPKTEIDKVHSVRMGVGNGLRQDVWQEFHRRFGNIKMCEVYGSTEGNLCFMNYMGKIGTVGRSNFIYRLLLKYDLVKYDMMKDEPMKDQYGFCQRVKKGDLMAEDSDGFISFKDRVGDTYRWKGENVATTEVAESLGSVDFIQEVNVYGVEIPGHEGRAGMAAMIVKPGFMFDGNTLFKHVVMELPTYARPVFLRLQVVMEMTSTFKHQKFQLVQNGYNPSTISDPLYVLDYQQNSYVPLTKIVYQSILCGELKL
ncbi:long-chain fatty acid transport protein 6 isoform X2 [Syngnathus scovelli]|uniref:long-chain fatty acid transport protein 6 isoform X2 n=1 Tax=Syngnathus scovelli TaxID=161590 RepID=UPI002110582B|nr:long-chain fatty acid transport protein 6 isoform X2 [Syngnathus scovelli]